MSKAGLTKLVMLSWHQVSSWTSLFSIILIPSSMADAIIAPSQSTWTSPRKKKVSWKVREMADSENADSEAAMILFSPRPSRVSATQGK